MLSSLPPAQALSAQFSTYGKIDLPAAPITENLPDITELRTCLHASARGDCIENLK
jgi:hypothetical protein